MASVSIAPRSPDVSSRPETNHAVQIAQELCVPVSGVQATMRLAAEGATVPFLARYRKEVTGGLDEEQIRQIVSRARYLLELEDRRRAVLDAIREQGKLGPDLERQLLAVSGKSELEDLYAPYKPRRRTRASIANDKGLAPLAEAMWAGTAPAGAVSGWVTERALQFVDPSKQVPDVAAALAGARDICAERLSDDPEVRRRARELIRDRAILNVRKAKSHRDTATKFDAYAAYSEPIKRVVSHRMLAIKRGQTEGVLKVTVEVETEPFERWAVTRTNAYRDRKHSIWSEELRLMAADAVGRLVMPSAKTEVETELVDKAHLEATSVFAANLRQLLLAAPLGGKRVLAVDPGQRTGCKCVALSETGKLLENTVINLVQGPKAVEQAKLVVRRLVKQRRIEAIAVGNGTHGRETERFLRAVLHDASKDDNPCNAFVVSVNEAGASVYSASDSARAEFPDQDITVRGAVSIGRRLQDPLAELVKIDPKSIGVGQYQHDVNQRKLGEKLSEVVESCVNEIGVEVNTASAELLSYVAGVGGKLAKAIVEHRDRHGRFVSRQQLLDVKGLGPKAFEQCAGFLRIAGADNPLDASAVHPERYPLIEQMAEDAGCDVRDLVGNAKKVAGIATERYHSDDVGTFTLADILSELSKPGRDPRADFAPQRFDDSISELTDLRPGMQIEGTVTNVTAFGAFIDVGVHQDGLVHVSELAEHFVKDPTTIVAVGQRLRVRVLEVDLQRKRISLSARRVE